MTFGKVHKNTTTMTCRLSWFGPALDVFVASGVGVRPVLVSISLSIMTTNRLAKQISLEWRRPSKGMAC